jgi:hypothetical protein
MRSCQYGGRADDDCRRVNQSHGQFADVGDGQVEQLDPDAFIHQGADQMIDHPLGARVHGYVRQHHRVSGGAQRPIAVGIHNKCRARDRFAHDRERSCLIS